MVGVKRRTKDTILQATARKSFRTNGLGNVRIDIQRSSLTFVEERGGLCNFLFTGPAFKKFLDTIRQDAPALLDRDTRSVVTQWRAPLPDLAFHVRTEIRMLRLLVVHLGRAPLTLF